MSDLISTTLQISIVQNATYEKRKYNTFSKDNVKILDKDMLI